MPFFPKVELMRFKTQPGARNFAEVAPPASPPGTAMVCRGTNAALGAKNPKRFVTFALRTDKYQALNGTSFAFFS